MTNFRALIAAAQAARHDPRLGIDHDRCQFRAVTHRPNRTGDLTTLTPEPLSGWMDGPGVVAWLREAGGAKP